MYPRILRVRLNKDQGKDSSKDAYATAFCFLFLISFIIAYVVGTHLNCIEKSMQFKWAPTTYVFFKEVDRSTLAVI